MSLRGLFSGFLMLTALEVVLSSTQSADRTAGIISGISSGVAAFLNPAVPAIPDLRKQAPDSGYRNVAPGPIGKDPLATIPQTSATLPPSWTTKPAPPKAPPSTGVWI